MQQVTPCTPASPSSSDPQLVHIAAAKAKAVADREAAEAAVFHFRAKDVPDRIRESKSIDFEAEERQREAERLKRIKEAAAAKCAAAALPPRMQARMEQEKEGGGHGSKAVAPEHSFAPEINSVVPDFASRHARSEAQLEAVKAKLAAEKKAIVIKAFELRSDRVYWSKIVHFESFYTSAIVDEGVQDQSLAALGLEAGCTQWSLLCALRDKVGGREYLMREVFEEFRVMPPGNLQVLADAERDKVGCNSQFVRHQLFLRCASQHLRAYALAGNGKGNSVAVLRAQRGAPRLDVCHHASAGQRRRWTPPSAGQP